jgi:hypothetical protein
MVAFYVMRAAGQKFITFHWSFRNPQITDNNDNPLRYWELHVAETKTLLGNVRALELLTKYRMSIPMGQSPIQISGYCIQTGNFRCLTDIYSLRSLEIDSGGPGPCIIPYQSLPSLKGLIRLTIRAKELLFSGPAPDNIDLPCLKEVSAPPQVLTTLFNSFSVPNILELSVIISGDAEASVTPSTRGAIGGITPDMTAGILTLGLVLEATQQAQHLTSYLSSSVKMFPAVTTLELHGIGFTPSLKEIFEKHQHLPRLRHLVLRKTDIKGDDISGIISGRRSADDCTAIDELTLDNCANVDRAFCEKVKEQVSTVHLKFW